MMLGACSPAPFTPQQEWVFTKFPECKNRTNAINVKLDRVAPDGSWYTSSDQTQTDFNLVVACMQQEWTAQRARLEQDDAEAFRWDRSAAEHGDVSAMNRVGFRYETGKGVAKDEVEAATWYRKAADAGYARSMYLLGEMYESGRAGLARNRAEAVGWYRKAVARGYEPAAKRLRTLGEEP